MPELRPAVQAAKALAGTREDNGRHHARGARRRIDRRAVDRLDAAIRQQLT